MENNKEVNETKLQEFMDKVLSDMGAAASGVMVIIGDQLGLYKAMAESGPMTSDELAKMTGMAERYIREWLSNQAAGGYVAYDTKTKKFALPPEQVMTLADENSPSFIPGGFQMVAAMYSAEQKIAENFKTGNGLDWGEHNKHLFDGTERFFRSSYIANLLTSWIPALDDVEVKLKAGAKIADVGCGVGASTILMAKAFPKSKFYGFDYHKTSIETARMRAEKAGVADRIVFEVATSTDYPGKDYDLVCHFDCLHDLGDPMGAAKHVFQSLKKDGTWMVVEPFAGDKLEDNLNSVGRFLYATSTTICVPVSLAQSGPALGAQAGQAILKDVVMQGGFKRFRLATHTAFNLILEIRP